MVVAIVMMVGCGSSPSSSAPSHAASAMQDSPRYAKGFTIEEHPDYTVLSVINPWENNRLYARYYLCKDSSAVCPADGQKVHIPIRRLALGSNTQFEFVRLLGATETVVGVCDVKRIYSPWVLSRLADGKAVDLGDPFQMNHERLLMLQPQMVMMSGYGSVDEYSKRVAQIGLAVVFNNEWMETSLLARAEWIKFVAHFFDRKVAGDSLFAAIEERYHAVKSHVKQAAKQPKILSGDNFRGTWYMPGGESFMGNLFKEIGANYVFASDKSRGSIPTDYESVFVHFSDADVWVGANAHSLDELEKSNERNRLFKPFRQKTVYNYYNRSTLSGGSDFWESGVANPDILLADFVKVVHPDLFPNHTLYYLKKLE